MNASERSPSPEQAVNELYRKYRPQPEWDEPPEPEIPSEEYQFTVGNDINSGPQWDGGDSA